MDLGDNTSYHVFPQEGETWAVLDTDTNEVIAWFLGKSHAEFFATSLGLYKSLKGEKMP